MNRRSPLLAVAMLAATAMVDVGAIDEPPPRRRHDDDPRGRPTRGGGYWARPSPPPELSPDDAKAIARAEAKRARRAARGW